MTHLFAPSLRFLCRRHSDVEKLQKDYGLFDLQSIDLSQETLNCSQNITNNQIIRIQEDRYQPGSYFLMYVGFILKYTPGEPMELFLGHPDQQSQIWCNTIGQSMHLVTISITV